MVNKERNEHGHWGEWTGSRTDDDVSILIDLDVIMVRVVDPKHDDPVEFNSDEALDFAFALLERIRAVEEEDGESSSPEKWQRIARLASP